MDFTKVIEQLTREGKTIATMESCTGGGVVNAITNIEGASEVLRFSAVTYSNQYKIKMGVSSEVIDKYSVYSMETADQMSFCISEFADSDYGVGITGKLGRADKNNSFGKDNVVFVSVYDRERKCFLHETVLTPLKGKKENKNLVIDKVIELLLHLGNE